MVASHRGRDRRGTLRVSSRSYLASTDMRQQLWPAYHGRITKQGRASCARHARRGGLGGSAPGPRCAFFLRVRASPRSTLLADGRARCRPRHLLTGEAGPALHARKLRDLELKVIQAARAPKRVAHAYNIKSHRDQERRWVEQAADRPCSASSPVGIRQPAASSATEVRR